MVEIFNVLFDTSDFPARWHCGRWSSTHGWIHILSDVAIFSAYFAIPCLLFYFTRHRKDLPFHRIFILFGIFIFACGTTHLIEAVIFWWPAYRLSASMKILTAVSSWLTVFAMVPIIPRALDLPGIAKVNAALKKEIADRKSQKAILKQRADDLERFNSLAVDREQRMIELKLEVNELVARLGEDARYRLNGS